MTPEEQVAIVKRHLSQLMEHFDTVQIFTTLHISDSDAADGKGGTNSVNLGDGNWFARFGQVSEWLTKRKARSAHEEMEPDTDTDS